MKSNCFRKFLPFLIAIFCWCVCCVGGQNTSLSDQRKSDSISLYNVAVCIVGQAQRLETRSKLRNLIMTTRANPAVDQLFVVGVLDYGTHYSNKATKKMDECYNHSSNIQSLFHDTFFSVPRVYVDSVFSPSQEYFNLSDRVRGIFRHYRPVDNHLNEVRFGNHLRQFDHDHTCWQRLQMIEHEQNVSIDVVARIRDNGLIVRPFDIISLMQRYA
ncbi:hypothetical protein EON65_47715, partial [archaeon]